MVMVSKPMRMAGLTKESTRMIRSTDVESINGQMARYMMVNGMRVSSMEKPSLLILKERVSMVCGRMEKERNG